MEVTLNVVWVILSLVVIPFVVSISATHYYPRFTHFLESRSARAFAKGRKDDEKNLRIARAILVSDFERQKFHGLHHSQSAAIWSATTVIVFTSFLFGSHAFNQILTTYTLGEFFSPTMKIEWTANLAGNLAMFSILYPVSLFLLALNRRRHKIYLERLGLAGNIRVGEKDFIDRYGGLPDWYQPPG